MKLSQRSSPDRGRHLLTRETRLMVGENILVLKITDFKVHLRELYVSPSAGLSHSVHIFLTTIRRKPTPKDTVTSQSLAEALVVEEVRS